MPRGITSIASKSSRYPALRSAALSPASAAFYAACARTFPLGLAVLHLRDPHNSETWKLVAHSRVARRVVGSHLSDYLQPALVESSEHSPLRATSIYRHVFLQQRPKRIGLVRDPGCDSPHGTFLLNACPLPNHCVGIVFEDVSSSLRATRKRMEAEWRLQQICETARPILWSADPATLEFRYVSPEAQSVLGYWVQRWLHERNFLEKRVHPEDWPLLRSSLLGVATDAEARRLEFRVFHVDGRLFWFRLDVRLVNSPYTGSELSGVMVDITDQKTRELGAREFSQQVLRTQEAERKRIGSELHENIAQNLTSLQWTLSAVARDPAAGGSSVQLQECSRLVQVCIDEIRSVTYDLKPPVIEMLGLVPALRWHGRRFAEESGLHIQLDVPAANVERLGDDAELALFRVFEECLSNVRRHAKTDSASARLRYDAGAVTLEIEDRGVGVRADLFQHLDCSGGGSGLLALRERMHQLRGQIELVSNGRGTLVRAILPRKPSAAPGARKRKSSLVARSSAKD